jgi:hypothetical protein
MGAPWIIKKVPVPPAPSPVVKLKDEAPVPKKPRKKAVKSNKE